jgi:hypothetical protein
MVALVRRQYSIDAILLESSSGRCPFLALSMQQRAASGGKRQHQAKVEDRRISE